MLLCWALLYVARIAKRIVNLMRLGEGAGEPNSRLPKHYQVVFLLVDFEVDS